MLNQCNFIGRLGADPESRFTNTGAQVVNFNLACTKKYKDRDGNRQERTEWVRVVVWGNLASICADYLKKGSLCYISGEMETRKWTDQNGVDRYTTEIVAKEMKMLDSRGEASGQPHHQPEPPQGFSQPGTGEDVPF